ncbi:unnamed protein product [Anisakis simplex]|uniref:G-patch domain-containing protein n=1 Tax=Anisakis simplex TaxID=6269 RepID=A0A158PPM7_ANISI|nr:unnamed protein product [Anisakis simplex]
MNTSVEEVVSNGKNHSMKISFGVKKKQPAINADLNLLNDGKRSQSDDEESDGVFVENAKKLRLTHFEDGVIVEYVFESTLGFCLLTMSYKHAFIDEKDVKKSSDGLVIPMVKENDWRMERLLRLMNEGKLSAEEAAKLELLKEASSPSSSTGIKKIDENESDGLTSKITAEDADYEQVPVESFGLAVLRGCGWKEGEGIGLTNKRVVPLKLPPRRPKGLGLGADVNMGKQNGKSEVTGGSKDPDVGPLKKFSYVKILSGAHRDSYGKVQSFDEDNASVIVELAIKGNNVRVSGFAVQVISAKEYERDAKCINKRNYDREKKRIDERNKMKLEEQEEMKRKRKSKQESWISYEKEDKRTLDKDVNRIKESKRVDKSSRDSRERRMWVRPELRVRFIDKNFKNGRLYNEKVRVVDAADPENCAVEDNGGKTYYQIHEDWLETVIPKREGSRLMILRGPLRGQLGVMERKDKYNEQVLLRVLLNDELASFSFDDVCEWVGEIDDD